MKKDEVKDALLTLVLVLVLQGDFQQSKDYIQKLNETCTPNSSGDHAFGVPMQGASEFSSLLVDFVVCVPQAHCFFFFCVCVFQQLFHCFVMVPWHDVCCGRCRRHARLRTYLG